MILWFLWGKLFSCFFPGNLLQIGLFPDCELLLRQPFPYHVVLERGDRNDVSPLLLVQNAL